MDADVNAILIAMEGRIDMLCALTGIKKPETSGKKRRVVDDLKSFVAEHNARFAATGGRKRFR